MASTFTDLGIEIMATGENAGTWGDKTNTNLTIVNTAVAGYVEQAVTNGGTLALTITDGAATATAQNAVIKLTGTITGNSIVTVPDSIEKTFIVTNGTSGAYTVQFKTVSGTGVTFSTTDKGTKFVYTDGTNINEISSSSSETLTSSGDLTLDATTDIILDADGGDVFFKDAGTTFGSATNTSGNLIIKSGTTTALTFSGANVTAAGNLSVGGDLDVTGSFDMSDANITNIGSIALDTITNDGTDITLDSSGDIILDAGGADIFLKDDGTTFGELTNSSTDFVIKSTTSDKDILFKGNDGGAAITALTLDMSAAGKATFNSDVVVSGDLTISGDDLVMGTNTSGHILVADGTNFNPVAVGDLSAISTVAADDVLLAVDTSGGGLKKITRSALVSGLAAGTMSNIVEDTSPQLGGNLDTNSQNILIDDAHFIADENGNEQIIFQTTSSAVNQFDVTNAATGNPPSIQATGGDSNIDFNIGAKGTGHVTILGDTNPGTIQFNCEQNSHGVQLKGPAHSASSSAVLTLPTSTGTLIGTGDTGTVTMASLDIDGGTEIGADIVDADLLIIDDGAGGTNRKVLASRIKTYTNADLADPTALAIALG
jgi:hypothetical protein